MHVDLVIIEPESPGNIGSIARVMKNLSFENLVLVNPCEIDDETKGFAMHGWDIIKNARVIDEMRWDEYDLVIGTTGMKSTKGMLRKCSSPIEIKKKMGKGNVALVFGRESRGLDNKEIEKCDLVCRIKTSNEYPVMNLSHAVAIVLYELSKSDFDEKVLAAREDLDVLQNLFKGVIDKLNYSQGKERITQACVKNVLGRCVLSRKEAGIFIGMLKKIKRCL